MRKKTKKTLLALLGIGAIAAAAYFSNLLRPGEQETPNLTGKYKTHKIEEGRENNLDETVRIASFNIQVFGRSKRSKKEVMDALIKIVMDNEYHLLAVQEFRDNEEKTVPAFLDAINAAGENYKAVACERLGRTTSKERYAFFYDPDIVEYLGRSYVFDDVKDRFEREPFIAYFKSGNFDFIIINIHTKPDDAKKEIDALDDVVKDALSRFPEEKDCIILGDFNADGKYFDENGNSQLKTEPYYWIIPNNADTTVAKGDNTYDRIVITGEATLPDFAKIWDVFNFMKEFGLAEKQAKEISDHFPVYAEFYRFKDND